ncbi:MAG: dockerin type I domain-containing protein [Ruminococcus sp.]
MFQHAAPWQALAPVSAERSTDGQLTAADIDGDGTVNSTDVYYLMYYIALNGAGIQHVGRCAAIRKISTPLRNPIKTETVCETICTRFFCVKTVKIPQFTKYSQKVVSFFFFCVIIDNVTIYHG